MGDNEMDMFHRFMLDMLSGDAIISKQVITEVNGSEARILIGKHAYLFRIPWAIKEAEPYLIDFNNMLGQILKAANTPRAYYGGFIYYCPNCKSYHPNNRKDAAYNIMKYCRDCIKTMDVNNKMVLVYFFLNETMNLVKIGWTANIAQRHRTMSLTSGVELRVIKVIPGGAKKEKLIHEQFKHLREEGEYFRYESDLQTFIEELPSLSKHCISINGNNA
jgi:hypothetical protein